MTGRTLYIFRVPDDIVQQLIAPIQPQFPDWRFERIQHLSPLPPLSATSLLLVYHPALTPEEQQLLQPYRQHIIALDPQACSHPYAALTLSERADAAPTLQMALQWRAAALPETVLLSALENHIAEAVFIRNYADGQFLYLSPKIYDLTGYTAEDFLTGKCSLADLRHPQDRENTAQYSQSYTIEYRIRHRNGQWRWLCERGSPLDSSPTLILGTFSDISARKAEEDKLDTHSWRLKSQQEAITRLLQSTDIFYQDLYRATKDITEVAAETLDINYVSIWLFNEDFTEIRALDFYNRTESQHHRDITLSVEQFPKYFAALRQAFTINAPDARHHPATAELTDTYFVPYGIFSLLDAPIRTEGQLRGVICFEHTQYHRWTPEEQFFAFSIAEIFALVLEAHDKQQLHQQLQLAQRRTQSILQSIGDALIVTDKAGIITLMNPVAEKLTGWKAEEAIGKPIEEIFQIFREDTLEPITGFVSRILREGQIIGLANHTVLRTKDGHYFPIDDSGAPVIGPDGTIYGAVIIFHDITKRRRWEKLLEFSSNRYRALLQALPDAVLLIDRNGTIKENFASQEEHRLLMEKLQTETVTQILPKTFFETLATQRTATHTVNISEPSSSPVWYEVYGASIDAEFSLLIFRNITQYKTLLDTITRHQHELQTALDMLPTAAMIVDANHILWANTSATTLLAYTSREELLQQSFAHLIAPQDRSRVLQNIPTLLAEDSSTVVTSEATLLSKTGNHIPVLSSASPIHWGTHKAALIMLTDLRQLKTAQLPTQQALQISTLLNQLSTTMFELSDPHRFWPMGLQILNTFFAATAAAVLQIDEDGEIQILQRLDIEEPQLTALYAAALREPKKSAYIMDFHIPDIPYQQGLVLKIQPPDSSTTYLLSFLWKAPLPAQQKQLVLQYAPHIVTHLALLLHHLRQHQALTMQSQDLRGILDTAPAGIALLAQDHLRFSNAALHQLLDLDPADHQRLLGTLRELLQKAENEQIVPYLSPKGQIAFFQIFRRQIRPQTYVLILRDVTSNIRHQRYLELQVTFLERLASNASFADLLQHLADSLATLFPVAVQICSAIHGTMQYYRSSNLPPTVQEMRFQTGLHALATPIYDATGLEWYRCYWHYTITFAPDMKVALTVFASSWELLNSEIPNLQVMLNNLLNITLRKLRLEVQFNETLQTTLQSILSALNMYIFTVRRTAEGDYYYGLALGRVPHRFFQRPTATVVGQKLKDILSAEDYHRFLPYLDRAFQGEELSFEEQWANKHFFTRYAPIKSPDGEILEILGASIDISERKRQEEQLRLSEQRLRLLLENLPIGIILFETTPTSKRINQIFLNTLAQHLIGKQPTSSLQFWLTLRKRVNPKIWAKHAEVIRKWRATGSPKTLKFTAEYQHPNGHQLWIQIYLFSLPSLVSAENRTEVVVITDVTEFKRIEDQLKTALIHEQQLREFRTMLMRTFSHELRTPLASIQLAVDILRQYWEKLSVEQRLRELGNIRHQVQEILRFLEDLLNRTKVANYRDLFSPSPIHLPELLQELATSFQTQLQKRQQRLQWEFAEDIPIIIGDRLFLSVAFRNLLSNAIKYSPENSTITIRAFVQDRFVVVQFHDQGIGIDPNELPYIFESFYRASNVGESSGSGVGLSIVKEFIEFHNGKITVESTLEQGTTFTIYLPISATDLDGSALSDDYETEGNREE